MLVESTTNILNITEWSDNKILWKWAVNIVVTSTMYRSGDMCAFSTDSTTITIIQMKIENSTFHDIWHNSFDDSAHAAWIIFLCCFRHREQHLLPISIENCWSFNIFFLFLVELLTMDLHREPELMRGWQMIKFWVIAESKIYNEDCRVPPLQADNNSRLCEVNDIAHIYLLISQNSDTLFQSFLLLLGLFSSFSFIHRVWIYCWVLEFLRLQIYLIVVINITTYTKKSTEKIHWNF